MRRSTAVMLGKASGKVSRLLRKGGGTALPGVVAGWLDPSLISHLAAQIPQGSIVVTGTNGKTTTSRLIANFLKHSDYQTIHNRTGSNLMRGLITTLLGFATATGRLSVGKKTIGLFEIDEFVLPYAVGAIEPRVIVFNNLFRDQLDRYGEVDSIADRWRKAVANLTEKTTIVLNADDPLVASLSAYTKARVLFFGVNDASCGQDRMGHAADSKSCPFCGTALEYSLSYFGHLGHYHCPGCQWERPQLDVAATTVEFDGFSGTQIGIGLAEEDYSIRLGLPGLYNVYNALAAMAATVAIGLPFSSVMAGLESFTAAFGRTERIEIEGREVYLALVKNPIGFDEVLRAIFVDGGPKNLLFLLNDQIADGRDVSWVWDVDFEAYASRMKQVVTSGTRAEDIALRLKYGGVPHGSVPADSNSPDATRYLRIEKDPRAALYSAVRDIPADETLYVLPTYTAMLAIQDILAHDGIISNYWERE